MENNQQLTKSPAESAFSLETFEHAQRVAMMLSKSSLIPKEFQNNVQNVMIALEMANRIGASPLMVMQSLNVIYGRPSWSSKFVISSINSCGKFEPLSFRITRDEKDKTIEYELYESEWVNQKKVTKTVAAKKTFRNVTCVAWTTDKNGKELESPEVSIEMAIREGWYDKSGSKWKTMPDLMLRYRSASFFGNLYCPEVLMGMRTTEEVVDITHSEVSDATLQEQENRISKEAERIALMIQDAKTVDELNELAPHVAEDQLDLFTVKMDELKANGQV